MKRPNKESPKADIDEIMAVAEKIADHTNQFQAKTVERTEQIEGRVTAVEKEIDELKKKPKVCNVLTPVTSLYIRQVKLEVEHFYKKIIYHSTSNIFMNSIIHLKNATSRFLAQAGIFAVTALIAGAPTLASAETLYRQLEVGSQGSDVSSLQSFLAQDGALYPEGRITGYFGSLTKSAVARFQTRNGIASVGRVGPITLSALNGQMGNISNASGDVYAPVITSVNTNVGISNATVNWTTSDSARGKVYYSTSPIQLRNTFEQTGVNFVEPYVSGTLAFNDAGMRTVQTVNMGNLTPDTTYFYLVEALDASNNTSITLPSFFHTSR